MAKGYTSLGVLYNYIIIVVPFEHIGKAIKKLVLFPLKSLLACLMSGNEKVRKKSESQNGRTDAPKMECTRVSLTNNFFCARFLSE